MTDGPMSWQPRNTALNAQPKVTRSANCYLSSMTRHQSPHQHRAMRLTDHHAVGIKRRLGPKTRLSHLTVKAGIRQLGAIHMTFVKTWTVEQDIQDRSMDREDVPQGTSTATYSDVTNLTTPGPNAADGLHQSYAVTRPDTEVPHTLSASHMKY